MTTTQTRRKPWELARLADVSDPDSVTTAGAVWLREVEEAILELLEEVDAGLSADDLVDRAHEVADTAVPIYTPELWKVFVDLGAWQVDTSEFGPIEDMEKGAQIALYVTAETLVNAIVGEALA